MLADDSTTRYIVQKFDVPTGSWRDINGRIFVRDFIRDGSPRSLAVDRARQEADRQVSGWSAAYPLREYRCIPAQG